MLTRRELPNLLLLPAMQQHGAAEPAESSPGGLHLSDAELQELAPERDRALRQADLLLDLPLDGVAPGFVFVAR